jgi:hypothetical protein
VYSGSQEITEPDILDSSASTIISCAGDADGTIDLNVQGGNGGYTYLWSNGSTTQDLQELSEGIYSVIISDSKSCEARDTASIIEPSELIVDLLNDTLICNGSVVDLSVSVTGGTPPYDYLWNQGLNSEENQIVQPNQSTEYILKVNDSRSCEGIDSVLISVTQNSTPEICMVLVDSSLAQPKNSIVWEKGDKPNIDYYKIYSETDNSDVYESIGIVSYSLPGKYVDAESNPEQESKRYKITAVDTCGNESDLSEYHQTIHIKVTREGNVNKVAITDHYKGFDFSVYHIFRHDETSGWSLVHQMENTIIEWFDKTTPSAKYKYFVAANKSDSPCIFDPTSINGQISQSVSNIEQGDVVNSIINPGNNLLEINLYPNPAKRELVIETNNSGKIDAEIINLLGQKVFSFIVEKKTTIDISTLAKGVYFIKMSSENALFTKIFVKQ